MTITELFTVGHEKHDATNTNSEWSRNGQDCYAHQAGVRNHFSAQ
jgi:hypothetical protein